MLDVQVAKRRLAKDPTDVEAFLDRLGRELQDASAELRELARGIHPAVLTERGLSAAVGALATRCTVPVEIVDPLEERLPPAVEATAYFTVAEALTNVAKYAEATHAVVKLAMHRRRRSWSRCATTASAARRPAAARASSGLMDRVGALDGTLSVDSPVGQGTLVRAVLPLEWGRFEPWLIGASSTRAPTATCARRARPMWCARADDRAA